MSLAFRTGVKKKAPCTHCGALVEQEESQVHTRLGPVLSWFSASHKAPCGLPCFGGGAKGGEEIKLFRTGKMHGLKHAACPGCQALENAN